MSNKQKTSAIVLHPLLSGNSQTTHQPLCLRQTCVSHVSTIKSTIRTRLPARVATPGEAEQTFFAFLHSDGERLYTVLVKQHCRSGLCNASTLNEDELHDCKEALCWDHDFLSSVVIGTQCFQLHRLTSRSLCSHDLILFTVAQLYLFPTDEKQDCNVTSNFGHPVKANEANEVVDLKAGLKQ